MSATDPLATVWDALERHGCDPHGQPHDFRARCPGHGGDGIDSLHVRVGADLRVVLWCFAHQCDAKDIVAALGLQMGDLFPAGHRSARRRQLAAAKRSDFTGPARTLANVLKALCELGEERWSGEIVCDCPYCGSENTRLVVSGNPNHRPYVHCREENCTAETFQQALAGRLNDRTEAK